MPQVPFLSKAFMYWFIRLKYRDKRWAAGIRKGIHISVKDYSEAPDYKDTITDTYLHFLNQ